MFGYDAVRLHAALNDLPAALLLAAVLFDLASWWRHRPSLVAASLWCLWAGVLGGWAAVVAGNVAEEEIDHGDAIHELMELHETIGLVVTAVFTALLLWKLWRRFGRSTTEEGVLRAVGVVGLGGLLYLNSLGGQMVFDHAAGVSNEKMIEELQDRDAMPGAVETTPASEEPSGHTHPPGTPPHEH